jgi:hypothetical protein
MSIQKPGKTLRILRKREALWEEKGVYISEPRKRKSK